MIKFGCEASSMSSKVFVIKLHSVFYTILYDNVNRCMSDFAIIILYYNNYAFYIFNCNYSCYNEIRVALRIENELS